MRALAAFLLASTGWAAAPPACCTSNAANAGGYTFSLALCPQTLRGGMESWGNQVVLDHPPPDPGIVLTLSSDSSAARVPVQVNVPGGSRTQNFHIETLPVAVQTAVTLTLRYSGGSTTAVLVLDPVTTTIASNPPGRSLVVDGATVSAPQNFYWPPGSSHTLNVASPQAGGSGTRYLFSSWSDGGAQSHSLLASYASVSYAALFTAEYALTRGVSPAAGGSTAAAPASGDAYYASGAPVQVTASPAAGYVFSGWSGDVTGSANPISISMDGPRSITANFTPTAMADLSLTKTHTGSFTVGSTGTYTLTVRNIGLSSSGGTITLSDTLPQGLSYMSASGTGWSCNAAAQVVTCTNPGSLAPSASSVVTLLVSVAQAAFPGTVNTATVTNAGDANPANNTSSDPTVVTTGLRFVAVTPCRVADTRLAAGPFGGPVMAGGSTRSFAVSQSACGIPASAQAYSLNVTVVPQGPLGYLTLWPAGQTRPLASTLNSLAGDILANAAFVPAGTDGAVNLFVTNDSHVILDINGYFDASAGASFYPDTPCRVADTRLAAAPLGGPGMSAGQTRDFPIPSSACGIAGNATAYAMNVTVVPANLLGYLSTWPAGQTRPLVSTLNSSKGKILADAAVIPAGTGGAISVFVTDATELVLDINGHFGPPGGAGELTFYPITPCRVADTRKPDGPFGGPILSSGATRSFNVQQSGCAIPPTAKAYSVNVTVVPSGPLYYLTAWPAGAVKPLVSTLNSLDGSIVANAAIVPAGTNGAISAFPAGNTHVVLDINGYFQ